MSTRVQAEVHCSAEVSLPKGRAKNNKIQALFPCHLPVLVLSARASTSSCVIVQAPKYVSSVSHVCWHRAVPPQLWSCWLTAGPHSSCLEHRQRKPASVCPQHWRHTLWLHSFWINKEWVGVFQEIFFILTIFVFLQKILKTKKNPNPKNPQTTKPIKQKKPKQRQPTVKPERAAGRFLYKSPCDWVAKNGNSYSSWSGLRGKGNILHFFSQIFQFDF